MQGKHENRSCPCCFLTHCPHPSPGERNHRVWGIRDQRDLQQASWAGRRGKIEGKPDRVPWHQALPMSLKLKLQYFGYLMRRTNSLEKTLMLGKVEGRRRRGQQRMR